VANEPIVKKTFELPYSYVVSIRVTPWTVKRTVFKLLPWALVAMIPAGTRTTKWIRGAAMLVSPLMKQR
jgi:hypothetical protein